MKAVRLQKGGCLDGRCVGACIIVIKAVRHLLFDCFSGTPENR
jgi:hypothetical protein